MRLTHFTATMLTTVVLACVSLRAQAPAPPSVSGPTLAEAKKMVAAAHAVATKGGFNLACAILDGRGAVVTVERMDNAPFFTPDVARGKAIVTASLGSPSGALANLSTSGLGNMLPGPVPPVFLQGAVPLVRNNQRFGAIGCSGGTGQQDEDGAKAGAAAF